MKLLMIVSLVLVLLLAVAGLWASGRWAPEWGGTVVPVAAATNLGAFWAAFVPLARAGRKGPAAMVQALLAATGIRIGLVAGGTVAATVLGPWSGWVVSAWMILFYLGLLVVETVWTIRLVSRLTDTTDGSAA